MFIAWLIFIFLKTVLSQECNIRSYKNGIVCACNSTYCDVVPPLHHISSKQYQLYSSSESLLGFNSIVGEFAIDNNSSDIKVDPSKRHQTIIGFGGAFTDATGINIKSLPEEAQIRLLESYFGETGIQYSLCRVPIGGTDFSTRPYSYADVERNGLDNFKLQPEDYHYKIPYIKKANELRNNNLNLISSPWTAPPWMKTNNDWAGIGRLKPQYFQLWANYFIKFFEAYEKQGIKFWGTTIENEAANGWIPKSHVAINSMGYTVASMNQFIGKNLGPTINNSSYGYLKILIFDDNRASMPLVRLLLDNPLTLSYADGVAVHWYENRLRPSSYLKYTRTTKKDLLLLGTEACNGFLHATGVESAVELGSWKRGSRYVDDIFELLSYGGNGWIDWNMVLNPEGGPTYINNFVDSPIIANASAGEFYKQPMYYTLGHFSKFVIPSSVRLETFVGVNNVLAMGFLRPDNLVALVIYNRGCKDLVLRVRTQKGTVNLKIKGKSINTLLY